MTDDPGLSVERLKEIERLTKAAIFEGDSPVAVGATLAAAASELLSAVRRLQMERDTLRALLTRLDSGDYTTVRLDALTAVTQRCADLETQVADLEAENLRLRRTLATPIQVRVTTRGPDGRFRALVARLLRRRRVDMSAVRVSIGPNRTYRLERT